MPPDPALVESIADYMLMLTDLTHSDKRAYSSTAEYVLHNGHLMLWDPYTPEEEEFLKEIFTIYNTAPKMRECYMNAQRLYLIAFFLSTKNNMVVTYEEGIAESGLIPVEHAVMGLNGKPVDVTWRPEVNLGNQKGVKPLLDRAKWCLGHNAYWMVTFDAKIISEIQSKTKVYGVINGTFIESENKKRDNSSGNAGAT